jgi:hypothetical protein
MLTWVGENFKPEVILPLTDKPRTMQLMQQAGMFAPGFFDSTARNSPSVSSGTGGIGRGTGGGSVISITVPINAPIYGVDELDNAIHDATMAAMEEAHVVEHRSLRGMVR